MVSVVISIVYTPCEPKYKEHIAFGFQVMNIFGVQSCHTKNFMSIIGHQVTIIFSLKGVQDCLEGWNDFRILYITPYFIIVIGYFSFYMVCIKISVTFNFLKLKTFNSSISIGFSLLRFLLVDSKLMQIFYLIPTDNSAAPQERCLLLCGCGKVPHLY